MAGAAKEMFAYLFGGKKAVQELRSPKSVALGVIDVPLLINTQHMAAATQQKNPLQGTLHFCLTYKPSTGDRGVHIECSGVVADGLALAKLTPLYHTNIVPWIMGGGWHLVSPIRLTLAKKQLPRDFRTYLEEDWDARVILTTTNNPFTPTPITPIDGGKANVTPLRPVS